MPLTIKIAWRNIWRHKGKSLVIGVILFIGALVMTFGNGVLSGMDHGLAENIVKSFTGHIILVSEKQESDNVFMEMMGKPMESFTNMPAIRQFLEKQDYVERFLPMGRNAAIVLLDEEGSTPDGIYLLGVDFDRWQKMFPGNAEVLEGRMARSGERGAMVPDGCRKQLLTSMNLWFNAKGDSMHTSRLPKDAQARPQDIYVRDNIVFMGLSEGNATSDVRVDVTGVFRYRSLNTVWGMYVVLDIESYRECLGYFAAADQVEISGEKKEIFAMGNESLDDMFGEGGLVTENKAVEGPVSLSVVERPATRAPVDVDEGAYDLVAVLLKPGLSPEQAAARLNKDLKAAGLGVRAITWKQAIGTIGSMAVLIKGALFVFVMFLFFVAIIIIVNTLSMAALERTNEIGMMRAVGARKGFISRMFLAETGLLSAAFGGAGILAGIIAVNVVALLDIHTTNDILQLLYGGDTFHPMLSVLDVGLAVLQLVLVTLIAVVYPVRVAQSITPLDAIARE